MERFNLTVVETPTELLNRVQNAVDELLHLKVDGLQIEDYCVQEDLWYCKMVINILIVGEYCNHLPGDIIKAYNINWKELIQPRNSFAHTTPEAIRSTVLSYINNANLQMLSKNIQEITNKNIVSPDRNKTSSGIPKTILKVIHNCFESKLTKSDNNLPLFDDKLISQITDLSTKTIRRIRKEYESKVKDSTTEIKPLQFGY